MESEENDENPGEGSKRIFFQAIFLVWSQVDLSKNAILVSVVKERLNKALTMIEEPKIISVKELIEEKDLSIPGYQRPYKWSIKNVNQLIDDILYHKRKTAYRLGTIVFYRNPDTEKLEIVDGQQRTITIILIDLAIRNEVNKNLAKEIKDNRFKIPETQLYHLLSFENTISKKNIRENYNEIKRRLVDFDVETLVYLYESCELVSITLNDISEAFQFFDSQNARGKDLVPHDLLKAFHLRAMMGSTDETERIKKVENWEDLESDQLKKLFANYLFRIKNWSKGKSARKFTKNEVGLFKGISPNVEESFPFANLYRISNFYIDAYNNDYNRKIDQQEMHFPFQIDHPIINGKRFFEFVDYYWETKNEIKKAVENDEKAKAIFDVINDYPGHNRTGDKYVRNLFDCSLIHYWDKFGNVELGKFVEKAFVWAYSLRLKQYSVQLASVDNYAIQRPFVFQKIKNALHPSELVNMRVKPIQDDQIIRKIDKIINKLKELNYYE